MRLAGGKEGAEVGEEAGGRAQRSSWGMRGLLHKAWLPLLPQEQRFLPSQINVLGITWRSFDLAGGWLV